MRTPYCPECGYNLTGLSEHRCPECGAGFNIEKLLAERRKAEHIIGRTPGMIFSLPLFFIAVSMGLSGFNAFVWDIAPAGLAWVVSVLCFLTFFLLPVWVGCRLGRLYARAKKLKARQDRHSRAAKPPWKYALAFTITLFALIFIYMFLMGMFFYRVGSLGRMLWLW